MSEALISWYLFFMILTTLKARNRSSSVPKNVFDEYMVGNQLALSPETNFTGRSTIISEVESLLPTNEAEKARLSRAVVVLQGLGGVGKSTIALKVAYSRQEIYSSILWLDAGSLDSVKTSALKILERLITHYYTDTLDFTRVASAIGAPGMLDQQGKPVEKLAERAWDTVKAWMARPGNSNWLLVIDGADDEEIARKGLLPECSHGHIIVSSRLRITAVILGGTLVEIGDLDAVEGRELLLKGTRKKWEELTSESKYHFLSVVLPFMNWQSDGIHSSQGSGQYRSLSWLPASCDRPGWGLHA